MTVGMPGSGISALFYFCLVTWMPINEAFQTARGRSSAARWRQIAFHWTILASILATMWGEAWLLERGLESARKSSALARVLGGSSAGQSVFLNVGQFAAMGSVLTLTMIVGAAGMMRVVARSAGVRETPPRSHGGYARGHEDPGLPMVEELAVPQFVIPAAPFPARTSATHRSVDPLNSRETLQGELRS